MENIRDNFQEQIEENQEKESGWALVSILRLELNLFKVDQLKAGSYIDLPSSIKRRKACVNIRNSDNKCFLYCLLAYFLKLDSDDIIELVNSNYIDVNEAFINLEEFSDTEIVLNLQDLEFPLELKKINLFEKNNPKISINVFALNDKGNEVQGLIYKTSELKEFHINLIYLRNNGNSHYVLIKSLEALVKRQLTSHRRPFATFV